MTGTKGDVSGNLEVRISRNPCLECGARCCQYVQFQVYWPHMEEDEFQSNLEWVRRHEGITVLGLIPGKKGFVIKIEKPCSCLDADRRCSKYDSRPEICRRFKCRAIESYEEDGYYTKSMIHGMTNETREAARRLYEEYKAKGLIPDQPKRNNK